MTLKWMVATLALLAATAEAAVEVGAPAAALSGTNLVSAAPVDLAQFHGKVVLVDFWASWCAPCLKSLPLYESLRQEFPREDFEIIAVSVDEEAADAQQFLRKHPVSFAVIHDAGGALAGSYSPPAMPTSYLVDRDGVVRGRHLGFQPADIDALRTHIQSLIEASHAP